MRRTTFLRTRGCEAGFSLMEVLVSLGIFSVAALGVANAFVMHMRMNNLSQARSGAIMAVQHVLDSLRVVDPATLPASGATSAQVEIDRRTYTVRVSYCEPSVLCTSQSVRSLTAKAELNGKDYFTATTVFAQLR